MANGGKVAGLFLRGLWYRLWSYCLDGRNAAKDKLPINWCRISSVNSIFFCDNMFNVHFGMLPMFQCTFKKTTGHLTCFWVFLFPESLVILYFIVECVVPKTSSECFRSHHPINYHHPTIPMGPPLVGYVDGFQVIQLNNWGGFSNEKNPGCLHRVNMGLYFPVISEFHFLRSLKPVGSPFKFGGIFFYVHSGKMNQPLARGN